MPPCPPRFSCWTRQRRLLMPRQTKPFKRRLKRRLSGAARFSSSPTASILSSTGPCASCLCYLAFLFFASTSSQSCGSHAVSRLLCLAFSDRIMVLDDGNLMEFDTPESLLSNPDSLFAKLVQSAAEAENG